MSVYIFPILALCVMGAWLGLVSWLWHRLRVHHPATFKELGEPDLFWNNSSAHLWRFLRFLFGRQWHALGDASLAIACHTVRIFLFVYFVGFAIVTVIFFAQLPRQ